MKLLLPIWALLVQVDGQYVVSDCRWGSYSPWSECEGCNHTQSRWRGVAAFAQFGGRPCTGARVEVRPCETTRGCPVEEGCGDHFRCPSGQCISRHLLCNGDEDCEGDGADESGCGDRTLACDIDQLPPQAELTGNGYDSIRGEFRRPVINTKYFGGTCHKVYNGDNRRTYRLPHSLLQYTFQVQVKNDFKFRMYESSWSFMKSETGHSEASGKATFSSYSDKRDHFTSASNQKTKAQMYLTVENEVEVAQFISSRPDGLQLTSSFHRALQLLPAVYDQSAYRRLIEDYGTHYLRRGSLGGSYRMLYMVDKDRFSDTEISEEKRHRCSNTNINFFIVKYYDSDCRNYENAMRNAVGGSTGLVKGLSNTVGGRPGFVAALSFINVKDVQGNAAVYARWAGSVTENPVIIKTKLGPLDELVKGVACAGVKRAHLQRALGEYQAEMEPCHCRACANGGRALVMGTSCHCFCQPNTYGPTCQSGALVQQPEGGRGEDGRWSCWSGWSGCRGGQRQRARRCDNPAPSPGGRGCTGNALQHQACPDLQMQHLRTVEPHCFEQGETPIRGCTDPPPMQNGYVQGLQQEFAAGTHAIYRCDAGYYLSGGDGTVRCGDDLQWEDTSLRCLRTVCGPPELGPGVSASPRQPSYSIGQQVTLSCPPHMALHGPARITCDSGLNWDHPLTQVRCDAVPTVKSRPLVPCPAWKKMVGSACVCKMPYECSASVPVCAMEQVSERRLLLTWCKLRSLQCLGKRFTLVHGSECPPSPTHTPSKRLCGRCSPWETCDGSQGGCVCRAGGECVEPGIEFCVLPQGSDVERTVSECQAGVWRCQGQAFTPTAPWPCPGPSPTRAPWP